MKFVLLPIFLLLQIIVFSQSTLLPTLNNIEETSDKEFIFKPDLQQLRKVLRHAPKSYRNDETWVKISIPFSDGIYHEVEVAEASVVAKKIYDRYPANRSYKVRGVNDSYISGRMSITPLGIAAMLYSKDGNIFIEPTKDGNHKVYDFDSSVFESFSCGTDHSKFKKKKGSDSRASYGSQERKYIIAIASTGEFSAKHGNNLATINAKINDYLTLLNTLYERDLAITFELTADNDDIIFFDPATDGINPANNSTKLSSTQSVINSTIGSANYDIGHAFYEMSPPPNGWWGSGVASLGVVCSSSSKARGWTGCGGSYPNSFWMGIFAHEVGHQFEATHTFYGTAGNCGGSQRSIGNGVEPGSGNSLMSYEGSCGSGGGCTSQNISPESNFYYLHSHTVDQIQSFVTADATCYTSSSTNNSPPVITMPASKTIPTETPFTLTATVTDPDGDPLLNGWEEVDTDNLSLSCPNGAPNDAATSGTAPLFRSFDPSEGGNTRTFPQLSDILDDTQTMGEILPEVGRDINMRFISRGTDANGISGVSYEDVLITVDGNSGPFEVTTASSPTGYLGSESVNVQWLVGNTDNSPIFCSHVNILFSSDGGNTFPVTLASNVLNSGMHTVTMPATATESGRIKIEAVDNIFFSINKGDITIISDCEPSSSSIINDDDVTANVGDPSLDLGLMVGEEISSVTGTIDNSDPAANLVGHDLSTGSCVTFNNFPHYETVVLTASATDVYNFTSSAPFTEIMNIYEDSYNPPVSNCQNWLASSLEWNPYTITNTASVSLTEGDIIEMVLSGFNSSSSGTYTVTLTSNGSGALIDAAIPSGYDYKFVIYNSAGVIQAIEDEADLSDGNLFFNDTYTVVGLMFISTSNLNSYLNGLFSVLQTDVTSGTICGQFSSNDVTVTINGCNSGTKTVTSALDDGSTGTLRYKVENACPGDIIQFDPSLLNSTITLSSEIVIDHNITINGLGMSNLTLSGNNTNRIFNIASGINSTISNLSMINGYSFINGGAFINNGNIILDNIKLEGNNSGIEPVAFTNLGNLSIENMFDIKE